MAKNSNTKVKRVIEISKGDIKENNKGDDTKFSGWLYSHSYQLAIQILSVILVLLSAYITYRLVPLVENINRVQAQVDTNTKLINTVPELVTQQAIFNQQMSRVESDIKDVRNWQDKFENKFDSYIINK